MSERNDLIERLRALIAEIHGTLPMSRFMTLAEAADALASDEATITTHAATISRLEAEVEAGEPVALLYEWTDRSGATQQGLCFNTPADRVTKVNDQPPRYVGGLYARPAAEVKAWLLGDPATGQWVEVDGHRVEYSRGVGTPAVALAEAFKAERSRADAAERERNIARFERDDARKALGTVRAALKAWDDCPDHAFPSTVMEKAAGLAEAVRAALAPPRTEGERG